MPKLVGINHLAVEVGDLDEAIAFFERIFDDVELRGRAGNMAFVDLGDQFVALEEVGRPVSAGHIGLVVDDRAGTVRRAREAGAEILGSHDVRDPWGNTWQIVDYREVQFTKTPRVLEGMSLGGLGKSERALGELRAKGLAD
ncbi:MAG TPA: VOC family protein [Gaiellaceae bacterium]|nr:VOC family protein [Gaiellaceae bacterium]